MIKNMTKGNPAKLILLFSLPMLLGNVFQQFYNLVDSAVVGKCVGVEALAAVGSTTSVVFLMTGFAAGVATGFSVVMSQRFGANDFPGLRKAYAMTISISVIMSAVLTFISLRYTRELLTLMRTPADIIDNASVYLGIVFAGLTATIFYNVLSGAMRALGDSVSPLIFLIVCSLLNVGLDLLFVIKFGMGVEGVAYATVISQFISAVMCFIRLAAIKELRLKASDFIPDFGIIYQILKIGLPMGFQMSITAIGVMAIQVTVNGLGTPIVAAYTAASKIEQLAMQPSLSFGLAIATYTGQNLGAGEFERIRKGIRHGIVISMTACVIIGALLCVYGRNIAALFIGDEDSAIIGQVLDSAQLYVIICSAFVWILGLLYIYRNALQGLSNSLIPFISGIAELVFRVLAAVWLSKKIGFTGVCLSSPIAWLFATIPLMTAFYIIIKKRASSAASK